MTPNSVAEYLNQNKPRLSRGNLSSNKPRRGGKKMTITFWVVWFISILVSSLVGALIVRKFRDRGLVALSVLLAIYVVSANILVPRLVHFTFLWQFVLVTGSIV